MKSFLQFKEDIESRRHELRQRQLDQMDSQKRKVHQYHQEKEEKQDSDNKKEKLKQEIKRELQ